MSKKMVEDADLTALLEGFKEMSVKWKEMIEKDKNSQQLMAEMREQMQRQEYDLTQVRHPALRLKSSVVDPNTLNLDPGSWILVQFGSGSRVIKIIVKEKMKNKAIFFKKQCIFQKL